MTCHGRGVCESLQHLNLWEDEEENVVLDENLEKGVDPLAVAKVPPKGIVSASRPLKLLHSDLSGPPSYDSVIVDDYSRYEYSFFHPRMRNTHELKQAQYKFNGDILAIRSDNRKTPALMAQYLSLL